MDPTQKRYKSSHRTGDVFLVVHYLYLLPLSLLDRKRPLLHDLQ